MKTRIISLFLIFNLFVHTQSVMSSNKDNAVFSTTIKFQTITLQTYGKNCIRVIKHPSNTSYTKNSYSVIKNSGACNFKVNETDDFYVLSTTKALIYINKQSAELEFKNMKGLSLLREIQTDEAFRSTKDMDGDAYIIKQKFKLADGEGIYGFGQDQQGVMNYRNQSVWLRQRNMYVAVPFMLSSLGYGLLWDNASSTLFSDNKEQGACFESEIGNAVDYYFVLGDNMDDVIVNYRDLTGQVPMFPKWTFGFFQSRERYTNQEETVNVLKKYRELNLPIDCIVQDWRYWGLEKEQWNSTQFEKDNFPNPQKMMDEIHDLNAKIMISVWPSFGSGSEIYKELDAENLLFDFKTFPNTNHEKIYDAFSAQARDIYWKHMNKNIFSLGMDGWWLDATEPEQSQPHNEVDETKTSLGSYKRIANLYPLFSCKGVYENQRKTTSDKRVFILTRSAFAGQQRYGTAVWSGDIKANWDVFRNQIASGVNFSMTGIPYWTTDIGAFTVDPEKFPSGYKSLAYQELYVRWFQFSAFSPLFRSHGTSTPREAYNFGSKGYWAYDVQEKYLNLRYRFLPYIYSLAWQVSSESASMLRGLYMNYPTDSISQNINNQYFFGKSLLVAPVTHPQYVSTADGKEIYNHQENGIQEVYLPDDDWFDFWTNDKIIGGKFITRETPIDIIPLYVRAGSVLVMGPEVEYATEKSNEELEIRIYPGKDAEFLFYEDENDNYNYEKGKHATILFEWNDDSKTLKIGKVKGKFKGFKRKKTFNIILVSDNQQNKHFQTESIKAIKYIGKAIKIQY